MIIGQATVSPSLEWYSPLLNAGALGAVTMWFMWRGEKKLDEQTKAQREMTQEMSRSQREMAMALTLNSKSNLIVVLALKNQDAAITEIAKQLEAEIGQNEASLNNRG